MVHKTCHCVLRRGLLERSARSWICLLSSSTHLYPSSASDSSFVKQNFSNVPALVQVTGRKYPNLNPGSWPRDSTYLLSLNNNFSAQESWSTPPWGPYSTCEQVSIHPLKNVEILLHYKSFGLDLCCHMWLFTLTLKKSVPQLHWALCKYSKATRSW